MFPAMGVLPVILSSTLWGHTDQASSSEQLWCHLGSFVVAPKSSVGSSLPFPPRIVFPGTLSGHAPVGPGPCLGSNALTRAPAHL